MHAAACRSLLLHRSTSLRSARQIAGRRFPIRSFRSSRPTYQTSPFNSSGEASSSQTGIPADTQPSQIRATIEEDGAEEQVIASNPEPPEPPDLDPEEQISTSESATALPQHIAPGKVGRGTYGSARRRARRATIQLSEEEALLRGDLPSRNVKIWQKLPGGHDSLKEINGGNASNRPDGEVYPNATIGGGTYQINRDVLFEVQAAVNSGLRPAHEREADSPAASKAHLVLQSPKNGGQAFLDALVDNAAQRCRADVIRLDAQDIASFVADNDPTYSTGSLATLGYETLAYYNEKGAKEEQEDVTDEDGAEDDDIGESANISKQTRNPFKGATFSLQPMVVSSYTSDIKDVVKALGSFGSMGKSATDQGKSDASQTGAPDKDPSTGNGLALRLVESLMWDVGVARQSAMMAAAETADSNARKEIDKELSRRGCIIQVKDYLEMFSTTAGYSLLRNLHMYVMSRRKEGERVLLIGTTSSEDFMTASSREGWKDLQNESNGPSRVIIVPCASPDAEVVLKKDYETRILDINVRHLQDMIRRLAPDPEHTAAICGAGRLELQSSSVFSAGLAEEVWSFDRVQRLAHTALGLIGPDESLNADHVEWAINMIESSDRAKGEWLAQGNAEKAKLGESGGGAAIGIGKDAQEQRMKKLRKSCNTHEKRLLSGVVDKSGLKISFSDVHASPGTIDALKNLTSLSLKRPDAFTYGVLASEKIPGLLLYGPPGTGKTLLAKAVAKESGATILEVSGADIYDMYVGEGEKNVRAIFSLARKISPCVVFIDEADALFGARGGGGPGTGSRNTHREIVNQFLREWDGMSQHSTFIMVATNRPFDLDDAVLRRLPRRLLVDLPSQRDRAAILAIHLGGEQLAADVCVDDLARRTPFYSGSDLKNVCVAAALAAVREETEAAAAGSSISIAAPMSSDQVPSSINSTLETSTASPSLSSSDSSSLVSSPSNSASSLPQTPSSSPSAPASSSSTSSSSQQQTLTYPARRTLRGSHFDSALAEISASISEDMSTLNAIRKFDERYGDRQGRRKQPAGGWGFGLAPEGDKDRLEGGRVRAAADTLIQQQQSQQQQQQQQQQ